MPSTFMLRESHVAAAAVSSAGNVADTAAAAAAAADVAVDVDVVFAVFVVHSTSCSAHNKHDILWSFYACHMSWQS